MSLRVIKKMLEPLQRRVMSMVGRCMLTAIDDNTGIQSVQVTALSGEVLDNVERFQDYGITSVPPRGSEGFAVFVGGQRSHPLIVKMDNRTYRLKGLANGELALYTDEDQEDHKHRIHFKRGGIIEVLADQVLVKAETKARIEGDEVEIHAESALNMDCAGHGESWQPTHKESYTQGATGNNNAINAPEIP